MAEIQKWRLCKPQTLLARTLSVEKAWGEWRTSNGCLERQYQDAIVELIDTNCSHLTDGSTFEKLESILCIVSVTM